MRLIGAVAAAFCLALTAMIITGGASAAPDCLSDPVAKGQAITGSECSDVIVAEPETREIYAGPGNDTIYAPPSVRIVDAGAGNDTVLGEIPPSIDTGASEVAESAQPGAAFLGGDGDDRIYATGYVTQIDGGEGADLMYGEVPEAVLAAPAPEPSEIEKVGPSASTSQEFRRGKSTKPRRDRLSGATVSSNICDPYCGVGDQDFDAGPGNDIVYGQRGNDILRGGIDNDRLYGGIGDDRLYGNQQDDLISGGMGEEILDGNDGNDVVRSDGTTDTIRDSSTTSTDDTVSFATAVTPGFTSVPPGIQLPPGFPSDTGERGVIVRLDGVTSCDRRDENNNVIESYQICNNTAGMGGGSDVLEGPGSSGSNVGFENVLGSPYADYIVGDSRPNRIDAGGGADMVLGGAGADELYGGSEGDHLDGNTGTDTAYGAAGDDYCVNAVAPACDRTSGTGYVAPRTNSLISVGMIAADNLDPAVNLYSNLYLTGSDTARDHVIATYDQANDTVTFNAQAGSAGFDPSGLTSPYPCVYNSSTQVVCTIPTSPNRPLDAIVLAGMGGNDQFSVAGFSHTMSIVQLGGQGNDTLTSLSTEDMLVDGPGTGNDILDAKANDDILINNDGVDTLIGEVGNDLLLSTNRCEGDTLNGGTDNDNASWAKLTSGIRVVADLAILSGSTFIQRAGGDVNGSNNPLCNSGSLDLLSAIEDLEGSNGNDRLTGGGGANDLLGRLGQDRLFGEAGSDTLNAIDDPPRADFTIDCGPGDFESDRRDSADPAAISC
jgi:Ca2+-binding RTX toxin-like protein